jgi:putative ABC transport system permease protein
MKFLTILKQSATAIMANKVRSFLTVLGIIIGIGSVIGLMSLGTGIKESIAKQINSLGSTNLTITSGASMANFSASGSMSDAKQQKRTAMQGLSQTLTQNDLVALSKISKDIVSSVAGTVSNTSVFKYNEVEQVVTVLGVSSDYFALYDLKLDKGTYCTGTEMVLGSDLAKNIFGDTDPIGEKLTIQGTELTVVGVLETQKENGFSNPNTQAYITDAEAFTLFDTKNYSTMVAKATNENTVDQAKQEVETTLLKSHNIDDKSLADFSVMTSKDLLSTIDQVMSMLTSFLIGIAAISLLVGGIGIMNIMLVSVTERTREIGLRKALGAKTSDILIQFMVEAVVLTLIGGIFGVLLGFGIGKVASIFLQFKAVLTFQAVALAVGISSFIGIVFGVYPAARASKLNPIDALRYE